MSDKDLIGTNDDSSPAAESSAAGAAEAKRIAARRQFLTRGAAGAGFVVVTLFHQRSEAQTDPWVGQHILSHPFTTNPDAIAVRDCTSFAHGRGYTPEAHPYAGDSPLGGHHSGDTVWYCFRATSRFGP